MNVLWVAGTADERHPEKCFALPARGPELWINDRDNFDFRDSNASNLLPTRSNAERAPVLKRPGKSTPRRAAPTELDFEKALMYFHAYMYGPLQGKLRLYAARNIRSAGGTTMASDWEVFASILVNDLGKKLAAGVDLSNHEVKSAIAGGSYEYQYHKNTGKEKLARDMRVGHLFFEHADNLRIVHLRYAHGSQMKRFFKDWLENWPDPYPQRYRKNIPYQWVKSNGALLMTLTDGEVTYPEPTKTGRRRPTSRKAEL